ncbi:uncharacterized protein LOC120326407 [Styela clava]
MLNKIRIFFVLMVYASFASAMMMGGHGKPKILIRIGILHDNSEKYLAEEIENALKSYTDKYQISDIYSVQSTKFDIDFTENLADILKNSKLTAVFVSSRHVKCAAIESLFQILPFFFVSGTETSCDSNLPYSRAIYMFPSDSVLTATMLKAMVEYEWTSAAVLYQNNDEIKYTFQDMQDVRDKGIDIGAYEAVGNDDSIRQKLIAARRKGYRTYVLVCSYTRLLQIMTIARQLRLSTSNNHWFIPNVLLNPHVLHEFLKDGVGITFLHSPLVTPLTLEILKKNASLSENGHELFTNVVLGLMNIAMRSIIEACTESKKVHHMYKEEDGVCLSNMNSGHSSYLFCGPDMTVNGTYSASEDDSFSSTTAATESNVSSSPTTKSESQYSKRVEFDASCIIYEINSTDIQQSGGGGSESSSSGHDHARRRRESGAHGEMGMTNAANTSTIDSNNGMHDSGGPPAHGDDDDHDGSPAEELSSHAGHGDELFSIAANFNPCKYESVFKWNYNPGTCSETFFTHLNPMDSNTVFVVEHVHVMDENGNGKHELLSVGGYIGSRGEITVTYPTFKISHIVLPERDFVLGVLWSPPWLSWKTDPVTNMPVPGSYTGFLYELIVELSLSVGFNFTIYEQSAIEFGEGYNHSLQYIESRINELFDNNTCDIFLWAKTIEGNRIMLENTFGITTAFQQPKMYLLTERVERDQNVSIWQFLAPFREESWVVLYTSLFVVSLLMTYINNKNPNEFRRAARDLREGAKHSEHMGIMNSLWFNFAALVQQSSQLLPYSASLKVLSGIWWCFVMLVVSAYTASMISFMTQTDNAGITTLEELVGQQEYDYGMMESNPMLSKFLPQARDAPYSSMWEHLKKRYNTSISKSIEDALDKITSGKFIMIASFKEVVTAIKESCIYDMVGDGFYKYQFGFPVPQGWQFLPMINDHLARLYDKGIISQLEREWFGDLEARCETDAIPATAKGQLDLKAFIGMYVFLIFGVTGGIIVCICETSYVKYGGFGGFIGRANKYEFRNNHAEHQKPDKVMEKEFENWPGGWEVIKHRPFVNTVSDILENSFAPCTGCGQFGKTDTGGKNSRSSTSTQLTEHEC